MNLLSLCDPTRYRRPPLDVPTFYQRLSLDPRITFYHVPTPYVLSGAFKALPQGEAIGVAGALTYESFVELSKKTSCSIDLAEIDLVFCRTLKPYDPEYLDLLSEWEGFTRFVNRPSSKLRQIRPEFLLQVAQPHMPEAITTSSHDEALSFFETHQTIVAKRANSTGGRGVFKVDYAEGAFSLDNIVVGTLIFSRFAEVLQYLQAGQSMGQSAGQSTPIEFIRYLKNTTVGDKRVVVVEGEIYGGYLRRSKSGHWVNNVSADGECTLADITDDERAAIENTAGRYRQMGLQTLGYDFLMDDDGQWRISEINAGNIGGFARLEMLTGKPIMNRLIDWMLDYAARPSVVKPVF